MIEWLPDLLLNEGYENIDLYLEDVYAAFRADFIQRKPSFKGTRLGLKRYPLQKGKEATFWHMTTSGDIENDRVLDVDRCERIRWPSPIIEHDTSPVLKIWENRRNRETRILIFCEEESYLVVLTKRKDYILPWTAYIVEKPHRKRKLLKEYEAYKKARTSH